LFGTFSHDRRSVLRRDNRKKGKVGEQTGLLPNEKEGVKKWVLNVSFVQKREVEPEGGINPSPKLCGKTNDGVYHTKKGLSGRVSQGRGTQLHES